MNSKNEIKKAFPNYLKILEGKQQPKFQTAKEKGILNRKIKQAEEILGSCELCERKCKVNRLNGELGFCKAGLNWKIFGAHEHFGEEFELIPSGTIFSAGCTMRCCYCQNAPESITPNLGIDWSEKEVAWWIEEKWKAGCKNINFVGGDPTPYISSILKSLKLCKAPVPVIWNSNAYYSEKTAQILKDLIDIYLLDFRYFNDRCALKLSSTPNYIKTLKRNFLLARKDSELLIRILVIPNHINCCAKPILKWIKANLGENTRVNILKQYYPTWQANKFPEINRKLTPSEYKEVINYAKELGLKNIITQERFLE